MAIIYITDQKSTLSRDGSNFIVLKDGTVVRTVDSSETEQIILTGSIRLTPSAINLITGKGIDTVFLTITGRYKGRIVSRDHKNIILRRAQMRKTDDEKFKETMVRKIVKGKVFNLRMLLRRRNREIKSPGVTRAVHQLRALLSSLDADHPVEKTRGFEGRASAVYFGCFGELITAGNFTFTGRNRRPPRDPVNAVLSFTYTLLMNKVLDAVQQAGLFPDAGFLHEDAYGRPSLALDLMEEFRPVLADTLVLRLINKQTIKLEDFYFNEDAFPLPDENSEISRDGFDPKKYPVLLTPEGRKKLLINWDRQLNTPVYYPRTGKRHTCKDIILEQARLAARHIQEKDDYTPFQTR